MATTYENMVLSETMRHEKNSQKDWGKQHAETRTFPLDSQQYANLEALKEKVADLCDLQPTPASMVRPPRKVCSVPVFLRGRLCTQQAWLLLVVAVPLARALIRCCVCSRAQSALKELRAELATSLSDVEKQLEALGGSATTVSRITARSAATGGMGKPLAPIGEE